MDIDEIRRQNILILEREAGSPAAMHEAVGMTYVQYVNLRDGAKDARSGKPRGMRKETARRFEAAGKKPLGWLDQEHGEGQHIAEVVRLMQGMSMAGRAVVLDKARDMAREYPAKTQQKAA